MAGDGGLARVGGVGLVRRHVRVLAVASVGRGQDEATSRTRRRTEHDTKVVERSGLQSYACSVRAVRVLLRLRMGQVRVEGRMEREGRRVRVDGGHGDGVHHAPAGHLGHKEASARTSR